MHEVLNKFHEKREESLHNQILTSTIATKCTNFDCSKKMIARFELENQIKFGWTY